MVGEDDRAQEYLRKIQVYTGKVLLDAKTIGQPEFVAKYAHPFLVGPPVKEMSTRRIGSAITANAGFTPADLMAYMQDKSKVPKTTDDLAIYPLKNREVGRKDGGETIVYANAFTGMVTLGKAFNNDIVIYDGLVSAVHANFKEKGDLWTVTPSSTSNGVSIDDRVIEIEEVLTDGNKLRFLHYPKTFTFYTNEGLQRFITS